MRDQTHLPVLSLAIPDRYTPFLDVDSRLPSQVCSLRVSGESVLAVAHNTLRRYLLAGDNVSIENSRWGGKKRLDV